jgi:hypothetical protein
MAMDQENTIRWREAFLSIRHSVDASSEPETEKLLNWLTNQGIRALNIAATELRESCSPEPFVEVANNALMLNEAYIIKQVPFEIHMRLLNHLWLSYCSR